ncbi:MAG: DUF268 domain-containing protein [Solirubrobacterales bacterium]|nr:DUF268 domain-containing protein [Solirubrobacterales bacterium]
MSTLRARAQRLPPLIPYLGMRALSAAALPPALAHHVRNRHRYRSLPGAERLRLADSFPKLADRLPTTPYDPHYLHQDTWAAQRVSEHGPDRHVDVGSRVDYVCFLTSLTAVSFVDIRPLDVQIEGLTSVEGSVLAMPFEDGSLESVSCLHVAEHIGLGRYGDPLDPQGSVKAMAELQRVLAPGGRLLFSLPVGRPRVCFDAHRIHAPQDVIDRFAELELVEFAGVDDEKVFARHRRPDELSAASYACGMFHFRRPDS